MSELDGIDGLVDEALVRAREQNVAAEKARRAIEAPERQAALGAVASEAVAVSAIPDTVSQRRPAPPSERVEEAVAPPARLAQGELVPAPGRAKIELNVPPEPVGLESEGPRSPEDVVISEPFQKLPEAPSRHAKTDLRMRPPVAKPAKEAGRDAGAVGAAAAGARTVGGRTERLAPVVASAEPTPGEPTPEPDRIEVAGVLARTLGGRTERGLPSLGSPAASPATPNGSTESDPPAPGDASPWREGAGGELSDAVLPSSLMPALARDDAGAHTSTAPIARSEPPSSHASEMAATRRRNRTIVAGLAGLLSAGALVLVVLASDQETDASAIDVSTGRDAAAPVTEGSDTLGQPDRRDSTPEAASPDGGAVLPPSAGSANAVRPNSAGGSRPSPTSTARATSSPGPGSTSRPTAAPASTSTSGSSGLFFEKGSN